MGGLRAHVGGKARVLDHVKEDREALDACPDWEHAQKQEGLRREEEDGELLVVRLVPSKAVDVLLDGQGERGEEIGFHSYPRTLRASLLALSIQLLVHVGQALDQFAVLLVDNR